jgi:hypothetical protein
MHPNASHDTSEFCCDSIALVAAHGCRHYPALTACCSFVTGCSAAHWHVVRGSVREQYIEKAKTGKVIKVTVNILTGVYVTGKNAQRIFLKT